LLSHHPLGGGFLAVPGLKELFGEALESLDVDSGVDGATHALHLEFLAKGEGEGFGHGKKVCQKKLDQGYELFQVSRYPMRHAWLAGSKKPAFADGCPVV
jgi:hypothetical protein